MEIELSVGKILIRDLTWGEENDCYQASEVEPGKLKESVFWRLAEQIMSNKSPTFINGLSRDDGLKLRLAVKAKFNGDVEKK